MNSTTQPQLWQWISVRMVSLAFIAILLVEGGMWFRFFWWLYKLRRELPEGVREEILFLEKDHAANADRLRELYGYYFYGDFFAPEALKSDLIFFTGLVLFSLPLIVAGGIFISLRMSRQLTSVASAAKKIANTEFKSRATISPDTPAALRSFAEDFNYMAERLERTDRELQASSAAIAHELRTPLTAAKARLQALLDGVFDTTPSQLTTIMRQLEQLNLLVTDLYLLNLANAGQLTLFPSKISLKELIEERISWAMPNSNLQHLGIQVTCSNTLTLIADRNRLGQTLSILIDNAARYAADGGYFAVSAYAVSSLTVINVEDAGPGFPPDKLKNACDRFWRAEVSRSRHAGGSGLGLAVAVAICQAHGGRLTVHNRQEGGARITIELPVESG